MKRIMMLIPLIWALLCGMSLADSLTFPKDLTVIEAEAFRGDASLANATLGEQVVEIGEKAFAFSALRSINLPFQSAEDRGQRF